MQESEATSSAASKLGGPQLAADYCLITWNHPGNRAGGTFAIMCNALVSYAQNWSPTSNIFCNCHASLGGEGEEQEN